MLFCHGVSVVERWHLKALKVTNMSCMMPHCSDTCRLQTSLKGTAEIYKNQLMLFSHICQLTHAFNISFTIQYVHAERHFIYFKHIFHVFLKLKATQMFVSFTIRTHGHTFRVVLLVQKE